ncbi:hypothetical protein TNCV_2740861 [Trichonephila clavipes]|nr:hypothetical protein TNCV_2740861 [Trichonephila clavipes]
MNPSCFTHTVRGSGGIIMIWSKFCWYRSDALVCVFFEDEKTAIRCLDILADQVHPAVLHFYPDGEGYLIDDIAIIHRARSVQNCFVEHLSLTSNTFPGHRIAWILTP